MKSQKEIENTLADMRLELSSEHHKDFTSNNVLMGRIGTLLWVLDREEESIEGTKK